MHGSRQKETKNLMKKVIPRAVFVSQCVSPCMRMRQTRAKLYCRARNLKKGTHQPSTEKAQLVTKEQYLHAAPECKMTPLLEYRIKRETRTKPQS